jgi:hypothetical protein
LLQHHHQLSCLILGDKETFSLYCMWSKLELGNQIPEESFENLACFGILNLFVVTFAAFKAQTKVQLPF